MTKAMHILLAPDSFKGTLTSRQVIEALTQAAAELLPTAVLTPIPIADGGEGTVEAMAAARIISLISGVISLFSKTRTDLRFIKT